MSAGAHKSGGKGANSPAITLRGVHKAFGAKQVGMGALCASGGAVASAIYDATGVMLYELPATPERVLRALEGKGQAGRRP